jgi:hypothetical protein
VKSIRMDFVARSLPVGLLVVMAMALVIGGQDHAAQLVVGFGPYIVAAWAIAFAFIRQQKNDGKETDVVALSMTLGLLVVIALALFVGGRDHAAELLLGFGPYFVAAWAIAFAYLDKQKNV